MRFYNFIQEKTNKITGKKMSRTMIGYKVNVSDINQTIEYIKSWLDSYNISYQQNDSPHITVAQITGTYSKPKLVRIMQRLPSNFTMNPKRLKLLHGKYVGKYFITVEMKKNDKYKKAHDIVANELTDIKVFEDGMIPHISLFIIEEKDIEDLRNNFEEIAQKVPKLPKVKLKIVQLFNSKFLPEFLLKKNK
ncbi:MAG: hypothetical protein ACOCZ5_03010 [bacterium]